MKKLYTSKTCLKMAGGRMHNPHPTPLDPPLVIGYRNHQKSLAYFSHLAPLVLFFFSTRPNQKGAMAQWPPPKYAPASTRITRKMRPAPIVNRARHERYLTQAKQCLWRVTTTLFLTNSYQPHLIIFSIPYIVFTAL